VIGGGGYRGATFDGTNDHMGRTSALSGASANDTGTCSFWVKFNGGTGTQTICQFMKDGVSTFVARRFLSPGFEMGFQFSRTNTAPFALGDLIGTTVNDGEWVHVLGSWDISAAIGTWLIYIDDVNAGSGFRDQTGNISWDGTDIYIGNDASGNRFNGDLAEFWLDNTYMDLSNSTNRRKFISAGGAPVDLGSNGSTPTGSAPLIYLRGPAPRFPTNQAGTGNFTVTGALTTSSTNPP
jgi:hypothetical protein